MQQYVQNVLKEVHSIKMDYVYNKMLTVKHTILQLDFARNAILDILYKMGYVN